MNNSPVHRILHGDNLYLMHTEIPDGFVDLVYLDPPFNTNSKRNGSRPDIYNLSQIHSPAFSDKWIWDGETNKDYSQLQQKLTPSQIYLMSGIVNFCGKSSLSAYLVMMTLRLLEIQRILKPTGSMFLHCDNKTSHYLKLILDSIFGVKQFRNEIIWAYKSGGASSRRFSLKHDTILYYAKDYRLCKFNPIKEKSYNRDLKPYHFLGVEEYEDEVGWYTLVNMKDVWQIDMIGRTSKERLGYPTQKPEKLLERIILTATDPGNLVLDPFCGSGTTLAVAQRLNRHWIGMDVSEDAVKMAKHRLDKLLMNSKT